MPAKKTTGTTKKTTTTKKKPTTKKTVAEKKVIETVAVEKDEATGTAKKSFKAKNINTMMGGAHDLFEAVKQNIHMIVGVVLVAVGLRYLWKMALWLLFLLFGVLFITGYFKSDDEDDDE